WLVLGAGYSLAQTPSGRILRRSSNAQDRPALFAAQFALSHACWLITYPLAGWIGANIGLTSSFICLAVLAAAAWITSAAIWKPEHDEEVLRHTHDDLAADHEHIVDGKDHSHLYVIDDLHRRWP
ncbi:TPA: MFS transporter, partial [Pseudomonas aeruginosa]|nr:MFS transporter [Pseudomonas aeruginosa]